jgi:hypothetical protein
MGTCSSLSSTVKQLVRTALHSPIIPVCGAGFSSNALAPHKPPTWKDLVDVIAAATDGKGIALRERLSTQDIEDVDFLAATCSDYLTAISLLEGRDESARLSGLRALQAVTHNVTISGLPVHQTFWSADWPLVITTNYDNYLTVACGHAEKFDYSSPRLTRLLQEQIGSTDANVVLHLHGSFDPDAAPPLVTWRDYLEAYRWFDPNSIQELASHMVDTSGLVPSARSRYESLLSAELNKAQASVRRSLPGRIPYVIDDLLANKTCLFLGFSFVDPIWRLLLHRLKTSRAASKDHFIVTNERPPRHLQGVVQRIPIADFSELPHVLDRISDSLGRRTSAGKLGEGRAREEQYKNLRRHYPDFCRAGQAGFIAQGMDRRGISTIVPFLELWCNRKRLAPEKAIEVRQICLNKFLVAPELRELRSLYWDHKFAAQKQLRDSAALVNEAKVRVRRVRKTPAGQVSLDVQLADYQDFLVTNHLVANVDSKERNRIENDNPRLGRLLDKAFVAKGEFDPREILCPNEEKIRLRPSTLCSNHLGVSVLIIAEIPGSDGNLVPALLCPPTRGQISSPKDLVMTASGSVDWPVAEHSQSETELLSPREVRRFPSKLRLWDHVWREFSEECLHDATREASLKELPPGLQMKERFRIAKVVKRRWIYCSALMNLCQNIERGGKPELFYIASVKGSGTEFIQQGLNYNWELMPIHSLEVADDIEKARGQRRMMLLRSPLDRHLRIVADPVAAYSQLVSVILDGRFNPVLRAHLASVLRWCLILEPHKTTELLKTIGKNYKLSLVGLA